MLYPKLHICFVEMLWINIMQFQFLENILKNVLLIESFEIVYYNTDKNIQLKIDNINNMGFLYITISFGRVIYNNAKQNIIS